jgi:hypothetical protein
MKVDALTAFTMPGTLCLWAGAVFLVTSSHRLPPHSNSILILIQNESGSKTFIILGSVFLV